MASITGTEDKLAIQELMARYNFSLNFGDIEAWVDCFTEDGIFECPFGTFKGQDALRQYIFERTEERREYPLRHMVTNTIIDVQGDRASAKCYLLLLRVLQDGIQLLTSGLYNDELKKTKKSWRFSHRKVHLDSKAWATQVFSASYLEGE